MITKHIRELSHKDFSRYGCYAGTIKPDAVKFGSEPVEFYRDMMQLDLGQATTVSFSLCRLRKREFIVEASEYHNFSGEMIIPMDGDILMHVGPATADDRVPVGDIEIYRIPKGTMVCIRPGVWHQAAFAYDCDEVNILVALPERTYKTDCRLIELSPVEQIKILP